MAAQRLRTFLDIVNAIREELGVSSSESQAIARIKRDINIVYDEVAAKNDWWWLQKQAALPHQAYLSSGTCSVTAGSSTVTLSASVSGERRGYYFAVDSYAEVYEVESLDGDTLRLSTPYTGTTNAAAQFKLWTERLPLPTDCKEVVEVRHNHQANTLEGVGLQEFRRISNKNPRAEGKPGYYFVSDYVDPEVLSTIDGMPALVTRASAGVVKTLVFSAAVPDAVVEGARIRVKGAGQAGYNGEFTVVRVATTDTANDTVVYIGASNEEEPATADDEASVLLIESPKEIRRFRELFLWPALTPARMTVHVDYIREAEALESDSDEPVIPQSDRSVLLYGALHRAWSRARNPEEATRNYQLFQNKLTQMEGKLRANQDQPRIVVDPLYLRSKRSRRTTRNLDLSGGLQGGSGSSGAVVSGTPNSVAVFNSSGEIEGVASVTPAELAFLGNVTSDVQAQLDAATGRLDTAEDDIDTLDSELTAAETRLDAAESGIDALEASDIALDARLDTAEGEIDTLQTDVTSAQADATQALSDAAAAQADATQALADAAAAQADADQALLDSADAQADATQALSDAAAAQSAADAAQSDLDTHEAATSAHGVAGAVVGTSDAQTLTNKTINGSSNTITNVSLSTGVTGTLPAGNGGTGLTSPGTSGNVLTSNGAAWVSSAPAASPVSSLELSNLGLAASVSSSALTIALKQSDGSTDPASGSGAVKVGFRSSTASSGAVSQVSVTGSLSVTVSSGSTLGHASGKEQYIYVYLINNAGTAELAVSSRRIDEGTLISTTAEGGSGGADDAYLVYSTTARSNVAVRLIGRLKSSQTTAGTWAATPTEISLPPFREKVARAGAYRTSSSASVASNTTTEIAYNGVRWDPYSAYNSSAGRFTAPEAMWVRFNYQNVFSCGGTAPSSVNFHVKVNGSGNELAGWYTDALTANKTFTGSGHGEVFLRKDDYISVLAFSAGQAISILHSSGANDTSYFYVTRMPD